MTIIEPIPDLQWGRGDWQDYISNWREKDAEYLQARSILRYQTTAARNTDWPSPQAGHVVYNHETQSIEMWRTSASAWVRSLMFQYLTATQDSSAGVKMVHTAAGGKGILITPTSLVIDQPLSVMGTMFQVDTTYVGIQSLGQKLAKLTTDSDELLSDTPLAVSAVRLTGTGTVLDATGKSVTVGTLTSGAITSSGAITTTGNVQAAALNGTSATIGGVTIATNQVNASGSFNSQQGTVYGDSTGMIVRQRNSGSGALGSAYLYMQTSNSSFYGDVYMNNYLRIMGGLGIPWHNSGGTHVAWISPTIVSGGDPGAANYPDGTVWVQP